MPDTAHNPNELVGRIRILLAVERILNKVWSMCTQSNCSLNGMEDREVHLRCFFRSNRDGRFVLIVFEIGSKGAHLGLVVFRFLKIVFDRTQARFA